jgi:hypothetical protein
MKIKPLTKNELIEALYRNQVLVSKLNSVLHTYEGLTATNDAIKAMQAESIARLEFELAYTKKQLKGVSR